MRSGLSTLRVPDPVAELMLNHALSGELAQTYDRAERWEERVEAAERWAEHVWQAVGGGANFVPLARAPRTAPSLRLARLWRARRGQAGWFCPPRPEIAPPAPARSYFAKARVTRSRFTVTAPKQKGLPILVLLRKMSVKVYIAPSGSR